MLAVLCPCAPALCGLDGISSRRSSMRHGSTSCSPLSRWRTLRKAWEAGAVCPLLPQHLHPGNGSILIGPIRPVHPRGLCLCPLSSFRGRTRSLFALVLVQLHGDARHPDRRELQAPFAILGWSTRLRRIGFALYRLGRLGFSFCAKPSCLSPRNWKMLPHRSKVCSQPCRMHDGRSMCRLALSDLSWPMGWSRSATTGTTSCGRW